MSDKTLLRFVIGISIFVFLVVLVLNRKLIPAPAIVPSFAYFLPKLNACINGVCSILLLISFYFIKTGNLIMHKRINVLTFLLSVLFLTSYILFHYLAPETYFGDLNGDGQLSKTEIVVAGKLRYFYYVILVSHITLAGLVLPLILLSFYRGLHMQVSKHKKLVKWAFPIWLYVTLTGVLVYLMIAPYYRF